MTFPYETNILNQPNEGIGSSFWAAKIAEFLWREYVQQQQMDAIALQSYDFVSPNDIIIIFSHRGAKTFSIRALKVAKEHFGTVTVLITGMKSPDSINTDIRIETCHQENCGAFTISLTSAIVRILQ